MQTGNATIYESQRDTTLVLEDIERLVEGLGQLASGRIKSLAFDPIEPVFGLAICNLTESGMYARISSIFAFRRRRY